MSINHRELLSKALNPNPEDVREAEKLISRIRLSVGEGIDNGDTSKSSCPRCNSPRKGRRCSNRLCSDSY